MRGWRGASRLGRAACVAQKIADISTCPQFSAVFHGAHGSWAAFAIAVVRVSFCSVLGALFGRAGHFSGVGFEFWWVVRCMMPMGPGPRFAPWSGCSRVLAFCVGDFWWPYVEALGGGRWSFSLSE